MGLFRAIDSYYKLHTRCSVHDQSIMLNSIYNCLQHLFVKDLFSSFSTSSTFRCQFGRNSVYPVYPSPIKICGYLLLLTPVLARDYKYTYQLRTSCHSLSTWHASDPSQQGEWFTARRSHAFSCPDLLWLSPPRSLSSETQQSLLCCARDLCTPIVMPFLCFSSELAFSAPHTPPPLPRIQLE